MRSSPWTPPTRMRMGRRLSFGPNSSARTGYRWRPRSGSLTSVRTSTRPAGLTWPASASSAASSGSGSPILPRSRSGWQETVDLFAEGRGDVGALAAGPETESRPEAELHLRHAGADREECAEPAADRQSQAHRDRNDARPRPGEIAELLAIARGEEHGTAGAARPPGLAMREQARAHRPDERHRGQHRERGVRGRLGHDERRAVELHGAGGRPAHVHREAAQRGEVLGDPLRVAPAQPPP